MLFFQLHVNSRPAAFLRNSWLEAAKDGERQGLVEVHSSRVIEAAPCAEVRKVDVPLSRLHKGVSNA
jgi:hypothetical protein